MWHAQNGQDELYYIVKGSLRIEFQDHATEKIPTVPSGVRHNTVAQKDCWVLLIGSADTKHTGEEMTSLTRALEEQLSYTSKLR